jgi:hypothetical protein
MPLGFDLPAPFIDTATILSASDLNRLRAAAIALDQLSFRRWPCTVSTFGRTDEPGGHPAGAYRVTWGTFRFVTGLTTLYVAGSYEPSGSEILRIFLNGVERDTVTSGPTFLRAIAINALGFADGDIVAVEVRADAASNKLARFSISGMTVTPVPALASWPGVPTFTTSYPASALNQLRTAIAHLTDQIARVPIMVPPAQQWSQATHKVEAALLGTWWVLRVETTDRLIITGSAIIRNAGERLLVTVNGATVYTGSTWTPGAYTIDLNLDISAEAALGVRRRVQIIADTTAAGNQDPRQTYNSRYVINPPHVGPATTRPVQTPPPAFDGNASISQATLTTRLNAIGTMLTTINNRLAAASGEWAQIGVFRRRPVLDDTQNSRLARQYVWRGVRWGDRLIVAGIGVQLAWGAITVETTDTGPDYSTYTYQYTETLTSSETIATQEIWFDAYAALPPGTTYTLLGDVVYAAEYLR